MKTLTEKQKSILKFILEFSEQYKMPPTINEIAEHFNVKGPTVFSHLSALQKKHFITRSSKSRSISFPNRKYLKRKLNDRPQTPNPGSSKKFDKDTTN